MPGVWEQSSDKLLIGILSTGLVTIDWAISFFQLQKPPGTLIRVWRGLPFDVARNRLAKDARELGCRHVFMLDSDVRPIPQAIPHLVSQELPIISGLYWSKRGHPGIWKRNPEGKGYDAIIEWPTAAPFEIDAVGAGCLLIDMRVFDALDKAGLPWFTWEIDDPSQQEGKYSEDFSFARACQKAGFKIYCDPRVACIHEHNVAFDPRGKIDIGEVVK